LNKLWSVFKNLKISILKYYIIGEEKGRAFLINHPVYLL